MDVDYNARPDNPWPGFALQVVLDKLPVLGDAQRSLGNRDAEKVSEAASIDLTIPPQSIVDEFLPTICIPATLGLHFLE